MRIVIFLIGITNFIYVPIVSKSGINWYFFLYDIPRNFEVDLIRLIIQSLILTLLFVATYTRKYKKFIQFLKNADTIDLDTIKKENISMVFILVFILSIIILIVLYFHNELLLLRYGCTVKFDPLCYGSL